MLDSILNDTKKEKKVTPDADTSTTTSEYTSHEFIEGPDGKMHVVSTESVSSGEEDLSTVGTLEGLGDGFFKSSPVQPMDSKDEIKDPVFSTAGPGDRLQPVHHGVRKTATGWSYTVTSRFAYEHLMMNLLAGVESENIVIYEMNGDCIHDIIGAIQRSKASVTVVLTPLNPLQILDIFGTRATIVKSSALRIFKDANYYGSSVKTAESWLAADKRKTTNLYNKFVKAGYLEEGQLSDLLDGKFILVKNI